ncbi:hypothetical protein GOODEAATRI_011926 [Goodea atripinnis]|uniref:Uncharacterized protein n=1 Tax=Goodea atripinnis TaxID=208336 RepID=A0ABV0PMW2_9TELE
MAVSLMCLLLSLVQQQQLEAATWQGEGGKQSAENGRVDQHGRLVPPAIIAQSAKAQQDRRRFSEAPPPRPPPPNLKPLNVKAQRKPILQPPPGSFWPPQMVLSPPAQQTQPPPQVPQQAMMGSNLVKMAKMTRSTPQLDEDEREKSSYAHNTKENLVAQIDQLYLLSLCSIDDCVRILTRHNWNLQLSSRYLLRMFREERVGPSEKDRPQISAERRV